MFNLPSKISIFILIFSAINAQYERSALEIFRPQYRIIKSALHTILGGNNDNISVNAKRSRDINVSLFNYFKEYLLNYKNNVDNTRTVDCSVSM